MNFNQYLEEKSLIYDKIYLQLYGYYEIAKLHDFLKSNDIFYYVCFGTLLGLIRDGSILNGDGDIDISVYFEDVDKIKGLLIKNGYIFTAEVYIGDKLKGFKFLTPTCCRIDIFVINKSGSDLEAISFLPIEWEKGWEDKDAEYSYLKHDENYIKEGVREITLSNKLSFYAPSNYKQHFINYYGENYNIPDPNFYENGNYLKIPGIIEAKTEKNKHSFKYYEKDTYIYKPEIIVLNSYLGVDANKLSYGFFNNQNIKKSLEYMEKVFDAKNEFIKIQAKEEINLEIEEIKQRHTLEVEELKNHIDNIYNKFIFRRIRLYFNNLLKK